MHPDDNPDARRAPTPSGRPPYGPTGDPRGRPDPGPRGPMGPSTGGHQRPVGPPPGPAGPRFPQSGPFTGPQGPPTQRPPGPPPQGRPAPRPPIDPRQAPATRAHPPQVLSGPAADSNAAYSLQNPDARYGRDSYTQPDHTRTSTAGHEPDDSPRYDDPESDAVTAAPRNSTNVLAIVALVLSFLGLTSLFGVVCGHIARRQIRTTKEQGDSLAIAALWIGYFYIGAGVLCLVVYFWIRTQGA